MTTPKDLTEQEIAIIKARIIRKDKYQDIAADYRLNIGRLTDLKVGKIYPDIKPADLSKQPKPLKYEKPSNDIDDKTDLFSQKKK